MFTSVAATKSTALNMTCNPTLDVKTSGKTAIDTLANNMH
jgi:hypothetical protein